MNDLPKTIYIEEKVTNHSLTQKILKKLPDIDTKIVEDYKKIGEEKPFKQRANEDKNSLALAEKKGDLIKSIGRMGDGQYYLFHEIDCKYDCEYCYLQYYFQTKVPIIFVNRNEVLDKIEEILKTHPSPYFHVGEVCDALAFDNITEFSKDIANLFWQYGNGKIEFRTKSCNIENLISLKEAPRNVIPSWTMSPEYIVNTIEHKTPGFNLRLNAAKKCQESGYIVGIRLDPLFKYENWKNDYREMVTKILSHLDVNKIDYISLGAVKMHRNLVDAISERFPDSMTILGELVPAEDGKYRPIKFERVEMYRKTVEWINELAPELKIELSLESNDIKELVFN